MDPTVHNRVRELRQARDWTQEFLADAAGVSRQSINAIERQRYIPSLPLALTLARLFGLPFEELFSLDAFEASAAAENHQEPDIKPEP
jgi:putative transcriptional regulator